MRRATTLEGALRKAGVPFLFGCYPTELLVASDGTVGGLVMANRRGRQAVRAKVVVDATEHAVLARMAGAQFRRRGNGVPGTRWVTIAASARNDSGGTVRKLDLPVTLYNLTGTRISDSTASWYEYALPTALPSGDWAGRAAALQALSAL